MDAEVAGEVLDLGRQGEDLGGDVVGGCAVGVDLPGGRFDPAPPVDLLRPGVLLTGGEPERPGHVAHRRAGPVGDHVGDLGGVVAAVALVDVLDHLFPTIGLDVEIDVGRTVTLGRQEPFEQQPERDGIGLGDPEGEADRTVRRAPSALAEDVRPTAELDDVPHDQEVTGEPEVLDHRELVVDHLPGLRMLVAFAVAMPSTGFDDLAEVLHLVETRRGTGTAAAWARRARGRRPALGPVPRLLDHARVAGEPAGLFGPAAQVGQARGREPRVELVEALAGAHRGQRGGERAAGRGGVVHVVGGEHDDALAHRQLGQGVVAVGVERVAVIPQLDHHPVGPERLDQPAQLPAGAGRAFGCQRRWHRALPAPGEHPPVAPARRRPDRAG